jgi:hypothetical protein
MSDQNQKKPKAAQSTSDWSDLHEAPVQPKGPPKPWPEDMKQAAEQFVGFLKDPEQKQQLQAYIMEAFKRFENEKMAEFQARFENEREVDQRRIAPHHQPGNITPAMADDFNMVDSERNFARALRSTKESLQRTIDDRVEEINHLLAGLGGFSSQLKSCFARSTVVFLEEEDPKHSYRERLIFSINLPSFELKRSWKDEPAEGPQAVAKKPMGKKRPSGDEEFSDPRSPLQATWDDAVNTLALIIAETGLKPKYVKNDRHYGRFVMKQDLRSSSSLPDEYFSFTLDYNTRERIQDMTAPYNKKVAELEKAVKKIEKKLQGYAEDSRSTRANMLRAQLLKAVQERDFFLATTPDPNQLSEGLLFLIEVSTLKDYHIVKDRMQAIMTKYILHLSRLAMQEAKGDPELEHALYQTREREQNRAIAQKRANAEIASDGGGMVLTEAEIERLPQYTVEAGILKPRKKAA